jgi:dolichol-phosphate mannosyltransferase
MEVLMAQSNTPTEMKTVKVTIVSPTYNEAENVTRLVHDVGAALSGIDYELVIADDDSPDRTWAVAQELAAQNPRIRVLRRTADRGLSPAVIEGFLSSSSDYVGVIDADLQHDPAILPQMVAALDAGAEIAVGSRYVEGGGTGTWNAARRFQSWVATRLARTFLGVELTDPMSGYFILRRDDFNRIHKQLDSSGFKILLEIIARLAPSRLEEVPFTFRTRVAGQSKLSSKVIFQYLGQLWRLSSVSRYMSVRFIKFAIVGASGTIINLCAFLIFARLLGLRDWRISALATLFANLTNYVFNNAWTFVDRGHRGWSVVRGYVTYLGLSLVGMLASTLTFAGLTSASRNYLHILQSAKESYILALGFQLIAILVGTIFNYELHSRFTWRNKDVSEDASSDPGSLSRNNLVMKGETPDQTNSTERNFSRMVLAKGESLRSGGDAGVGDVVACSVGDNGKPVA